MLAAVCIVCPCQCNTRCVLLTSVDCVLRGSCSTRSGRLALLIPVRVTLMT